MLIDTIIIAQSRHMDTTSLRENGFITDMWVFVTKAEVIFHNVRNSNHEAVLAKDGENSGTSIHDGYSVFETLAFKTGDSQQYC
ncbi:MAG: transposase [Thermoplasmatales archaeon]